ncbi:MAG: restriction endonuclease subunit S [Anaerolineae bacterium]|nr:restriction endonuclease subunit S [Anaerolineae bacterium]
MVKVGFKQTEVGVIPEDWDVVPLENISSITRLAGAEYSSVWEETPNGEIIALRGFNIGKNRIIERDFVRISKELSWKLKRSKLYVGDVVYPCVGTIGNAVVITENDKYHIQQNIAKITPAKNKIYPEYLAYYLMSFYGEAEIERFNATSSQPNVLVGSLRQYRVPLPPKIEEQRAIAETLSDVDALIAALDKLIAKKRAIKTAAMQELLTGQKRLPGFGGEWKRKRITELAEVDPENLTANTKPDYEFKYISLDDVDEGFLNSYSEKVFNSAPSRARRVLRKGDVLLSTVRPNLQSHFLFDKDEEDWICSTGFAVIRCLKQEAYPAFVYFHLFGGTISKQIEALISGSNYPAINSSDVRDLMIPAPEVDEQKAIAVILADMEAEITALETRRAKTQALKQGMMQELLTGRTRLV